MVAGLLVDRERGERRKQERLARELAAALAEQRRIEAQLIRAGRLGALGELTAGIAHEIKNPLHALKGTAEILRDVVPAGRSGAAHARPAHSGRSTGWDRPPSAS